MADYGAQSELELGLVFINIYRISLTWTARKYLQAHIVQASTSCLGGEGAMPLTETLIKGLLHGRLSLLSRTTIIMSSFLRRN